MFEKPLKPLQQILKHSIQNNIWLSSIVFIAADIKQKISELNGLANEIKDGAQSRDAALTEALEVSEKFHDLCGEVMSNLRDLKDNMISQEPPGVDPQTVKEQQKELKVGDSDYSVI